MGRRRYRWSNYDYDQSSSGSYSRNRYDSGERQIKYRDRSRDRYNGYYLNKYRERLGNRYRYERGDRFSEMYRENDRMDCGNETYERNQRHKSRDRYLSGHDRWQIINHSHNISPSSSKLNFDMSKIGDSVRCDECGKTNHFPENCPTLSEQEREIYRLHNLQYVEYLRIASDISDDIQRKLLSRYSTEYATESVIDREVQYVEEKVESEIDTYVQEEVISHIALLKMYTIEAKVQENVHLEQQVVMPTLIYFVAEKYVTQGEMEVVQKIPKVSKFQAQIEVVPKIPLLDAPHVFLPPDLFTKRLKKVLGVSVLNKGTHDRMNYLGQEIFREVLKFKTLYGLGIQKNVNENEKEIPTDIIPEYRPPPKPPPGLSETVLMANIEFRHGSRLG